MYSERLRRLEQAEISNKTVHVSQNVNPTIVDSSEEAGAGRETPSENDKASEPTNLISCIRDGFYRLLHVPSAPKLGSSSLMLRATPSVRSMPIATSRLLPIWRLIPPVVFLNVGHYAIRSISSIVALAYWNGHDDRLEREAELDLALKTGSLNLHRSLGPSASPDSNITPSDWATLAHQRQETALQAMYNRYYTDMLVAMTASMAADIIMYPVETLVLRLCVQGTRTLVDNMDTGDVVVPIVSAYDGFFDALRSALESPTGLLGLYKGFGALIAQYALQAAFIYGVRCLYEHLLYLWPPPLQSGENSGPKYRPPSQDPPSVSTRPHVDVRGDAAVSNPFPFASSPRWNVM